MPRQESIGVGPVERPRTDGRRVQKRDGATWLAVPTESDGRALRQSTEQYYGLLARDSKVDVDIEPTGALPTAAGQGAPPAAHGTPAHFSTKEDQPLLDAHVEPSDEDVVPDKAESVNWWAERPDPAKGEAYRKCLMTQSEIDRKSGKREVLELAGGYERVDTARIEPWPLWSTTKVQLGQIGGTGVRVYFELLSELPFLFLKLAVLNTPNLLANLYDQDNMYDSPDMTKQYKSFGARSTLGSVYAKPESLNAGTENDMFVRTFLDGLSMLVLLEFVLRWPKRQDDIVQESDASALTMADYTVSVRPSSGWLALDNEKFDRADEDEKQAWAFKERLKEKIEDHLHRPGAVAQIKGRPAIWLAYSEAKTIQLSKKKVDAMLALEVALAKAHKAKWAENAVESVNKAAAKCKRLNVDIDNERTNRAEAVEAWVAFEHIRDKEAALDDTRETLEFRGQACVLREPPEPGSLFWDRLHIQPAEQQARSCAVLAATIVVLACGFAGVVITDVMKGNLDYLISCTDQMTVDASAANGTLGYCDPFTMRETELDQAGISAQQYYSEAFHDLIDELGMDGRFPRAMSARPDSAVPRTYPADYQCDVTDAENMEGCCEYEDGMTWQSARAQNCHRIDAKPEQVTVDGVTLSVTSSQIFKFADKDALCYMCLCECEDAKPGMPGYNETAPGCTPTIDDEYCDGYRVYRAHLKTFKLLATFVVVGINAVIKKIIVSSQPAMGLHNISKDMGSIAFRVFLLQLCMTGILVVILRADIPAMNFLPSEKYENVCAKWYAAVGGPLIKTMAINFCVPPCAHYVMTASFNLIGRIKAGSAITQNQMNRAHKSSTKQWNLAASYGELLLSVVVTLAYSSGIPLLLWVSTFGFTLKFWVEKWCMLRRYQKPALTNADSKCRNVPPLAHSFPPSPTLFRPRHSVPLDSLLLGWIVRFVLILTACAVFGCGVRQCSSSSVASSLSSRRLSHSRVWLGFGCTRLLGASRQIIHTTPT